MKTRFISRLVAALMFLACAAPQALFACAVCGGKSDSALAKGMNMGILTLLGVVAFVLAGIAAFGIYLVRREAIVSRRTPPAPPS